MTHRLAFRAPLFGLSLFALGACAPTGGTGVDSGPFDGGPLPDAGGNVEPECTSNDDCSDGDLCAAVGGVVMCVPNPNPPGPGDGTICEDCPAPGECRSMVCVQPSGTGAFCEFDPECEEGVELCIAGRCTPDPRTPTSCEDDGDCYAGLTCSADNVCTCAFATDCPIGLECLDGACVPGPGGACSADSECPAATSSCEGTPVCDRGICQDPCVCAIEHPNLAGEWEMDSTLNIREALPDWLDDFLREAEGPLRFIAGDATCIDFGLPDWVESEICDLVRPLIEQYVPAWVQPVARAIADMNDVLSTWEIEETMVLEPGVVTDSYRGTHTWDRVRFLYRGMPLTGTPETIRGWRFTPSPFNASAVCGTFHIERHDVNVSISAIFAWLVDALVYFLTDMEHDSLGSALADAASGFCDALADFADDQVSYDVRDTVYDVCTGQIEAQVDAALQRLLEAQIGTSPITLRGQSEITGPNRIGVGIWDGTLLGREFSGTFNATR